MGQVAVKLPPGPSVFSLVIPALRARSGNFEELIRIAYRFDDIAMIRLGPFRFVVVNSPEMVQEVLVKNHKHYGKDRGIEMLRQWLGNGLLTSEGDFHLRQRRLIQPAFHRERIDRYANDMAECAEDLMAGWQDGQGVDINQEMMSLTLRVIGKSLFNADVKEDAEVVAEALETLFRYNEFFVWPPLTRLFKALPIEASRRCRRALDNLNGTIYRIIDEHRRMEADNGGLLSMLMHAQHEDDGSAMSDEQVRDEALTLFLAGHETTAIALTWTWFLLARHPEIAARLHEELDGVLAGRTPTAADYAALDYTRRVFTESMRLYPPAYGFGREALCETTVGGYTIRKGDTVIVSPYLTQHDARYFSQPEAFDPDRWLATASEGRHKFAYFPFGGGGRKCIGEPFAWMEGVLLLAAIAQRWVPEIPADHVPGIDPKVTLRPRHGMPATLRRR